MNKEEKRKKYRKDYTKYRKQKLEYARKYREDNREECRKSCREYRKKNKERCEEITREWRWKNKEHFREWSRKYYQKQKIERPYLKHIRAARSRTSSKTHHYYRRGIKCFLIVKDIKFLWERDNAAMMEKPTIDRIDTDGHYTLSNCRFLEAKENFTRSKSRR